MEAYTAQTTLSVVNELGDALKLNAQLGNDLQAVLDSLGKLNPFAKQTAGAEKAGTAFKAATDAMVDFGAAGELATASAEGIGAIAAEIKGISTAARQAAKQMVDFGTAAELATVEMVDFGAAAELAVGSTAGMSTMVADMDKLALATKDAAIATVDLGAAQELLGKATAMPPPLSSRLPRAPRQEQPGPVEPERRRGGTAGFEMMFAGSILEGVGRGMAGALEDVIKPAMGYEHQVELLRVMGLLPDEIARAENAAWKDRIATANPAQALQAIGELRGVLGDTGEAIKFMPEMLKLQTVMQATTGRHQEGLAYTTIKAIENLGGSTSFNKETGKQEIDPAKVLQYTDVITRMAILTHGKVDPNEILAFAKQAGPVARLMTPDALMQLAPIIQAMGASRAGTALSSLNTQIVGGVMPERVAKEWEKLHLLDMKHVHATKMGIKVDEGGVKAEALWKTNPIAWIATELVPAMQKAGLSNEEQQSKIMRLMGRQTSVRVVSDILSLAPQIARDFQQMQGNMGSGAYEDFVKNDPTLQLQRVTSSFETFETAVGKAAVSLGADSIVANVLGTLADGLDALGQWANDNPDLTEDLIYLVGALSVFAVVAGTILMVGGAMAMLAGALALPLMTPILLIVAALTALGALYFAPSMKHPRTEAKVEEDMAKAGVTGLGGDMWYRLTHVDALKSGLETFGAAMGMIPQLLYSIAEHFPRFVSIVLDWFSGLGPKMKDLISAIGVIFSPLVVAITAIGYAASGLIYVINHWSEITGYVSGRLSAAWAAVKKFFFDLPFAAISGFNSAMKWVHDTSAAFGRALLALPGAIVAAVPKILASILDFGAKLWTGFQTMLSNLMAQILGFLKALPGQLMTNLTGINPSAALSSAGSAAHSATGWLGKEALGAWHGLFGGGPSVAPAPTIKGGPSPAQPAAAAPGAGAAQGYGTAAGERAGTQAGMAAIAALLAKPAPTPQLHVEPQPVTLQLDGRVIAEVVMRWMQRQPGGPNTGTADFNTSQHYTPAGTPIGQN
jgi:hypothetical protein